MRSLASAGAPVLVDYVVRPEEAQGLVGEINKNRGEGTAIAVQADISREEEVNRLFAQAKETFGGLDILVNNADNCY